LAARVRAVLAPRAGVFLAAFFRVLLARFFAGALVVLLLLRLVIATLAPYHAS
jgi:hypothetical protein